MSKMPEVYDNFDNLKADLNNAAQIVVYVTPEIAGELVNADYLPKLRVGEAVKITKWENELSIVPVKWDRNPNTWQWDWLEVEEPFRRQIAEGGRL